MPNWKPDCPHCVAALCVSLAAFGFALAAFAFELSRAYPH